MSLYRVIKKDRCGCVEKVLLRGLCNAAKIMPMINDLFTNYKKIMANVDEFSRRILNAYPQDIVCNHGCSACCKQELHLLPVEFYYLQHYADCLQYADIRLSASSPDTACCILLHNSGCLLYEHRPIICRTHGLPLLITAEGQQWRDCCPKNFHENTLLKNLPEQDLLHLERLNTILISVNRLYAARSGIEPGTRIAVSRLASDAHTPRR